jgi:hypothetical protein
MTGVITYGNVPGATCRDLLPIAEACPNQTILSELEGVYGKDVISLRAVKK